MKKRKFLDVDLKRLLRSLKPIRGWLALSALLCLGLIACTAAAPELLGALVDRLYAGEPARALVSGLLLLAGIYLMQALLNYGNAYLLNNVVSRRYTYELRLRMSDKLQRLSVGYVDKTPVGEIIDRMQEDVSTLGTTVHSVVYVTMSGFLQLFVIAVLLFLEDWRLALLVVTLSPFSLWLSSRLAARAEKHWDEVFKMGGELYTLTEESFTNLPTTRAFNREQTVQARYDALSKKQQKSGLRANFLSSVVQPVNAFANALAYVGIALAGTWLILHRGVPVGAVVTVILFTRQFSGPLERLAYELGMTEQIRVSARRVFELLDQPEEHDPAGTLHGPVEGRVEFRHVDFSYTEDKPLIQDLCLTVEPGQKVAIVGPTGAGKTTIVNLLMRFYDPQAGQILLDGQDLAGLARAETRRQFGMVLQDTWLFRGTVAENVAYGCPEATRDQIIAACEAAYCDHFIRTLPQGYDTPISEDSATLSAGQKQLLTIARALLADRRLLILDEATSNVDTRTELLIQKAMDRLMGGRTCFVIAHRLSTIVDADTILVIRDGRLVEQGTHRALLAKGGFYREMFESQYVSG